MNDLHHFDKGTSVIGVAISLLLFVPRVSKLEIRELIITPERVVRERLPNEPRSPVLAIYDLEGELFFGAAPELYVTS